MDKGLPGPEKQITRKHRFGLTPAYNETIQSKLTQAVAISTARKVFERLGWKEEFADLDTTVANRCNHFKEPTHCITVTATNFEIKVRSFSIRSQLWDRGNNSKLVQFFILFFREEEQKINSRQAAEIESEIRRVVDWADYVIPEKLPLPVERRAPDFSFSVLGGLLLALFTGTLFGFLISKVFYVVFLYEAGVGLLLGSGLGYLLKKGNYTDFKKLKLLFICIVGTFFFSNLLCQHLVMQSENPDLNIGLVDFIKIRWEQGIQLKSSNTGWIGTLISWLLQIFIPYFVGIMQVVKALINHQVGKIPKEVIDFAFYLFVKGKPENMVRNELAAKGWKTKEQQDDVFAAVSAVQEGIQLEKQSKAS